MHKVFNFKTLIFIVFVAAFVALMIAQQSLLDRNINKNASLREDIKQVEKQIMELEEERANLDTDEYIEKKAREKLGYVKSDETVFIKDE